MPFYNVASEPDSSGLSDGDSFALLDTSDSAIEEATFTQVRAYLEKAVAVTAGATTLTVTAASHNGRIITLANTAPITVTLPQATGTGNRYRFYVGQAATGTASKIQVANATDVMAGVQWVLTTSSANVIGYPTTATSDTLSMNGSTQGGVAGDVIEIVDVITGIFSVQMNCQSTGSTATPFSAAVS